MTIKSKLLALALCLTLALAYSGCMANINAPNVQKQPKEKQSKVEKQKHDARKVEPVEQKSDSTKDVQIRPDVKKNQPNLEKNPPDIMGTYEKAVANDKEGKSEEAYKLYKEFLNSVPKVEESGKVEDPAKKEEREKAIEHAKKRINELGKYKEEQPKPLVK